MSANRLRETVLALAVTGLISAGSLAAVVEHPASPTASASPVAAASPTAQPSPAAETSVAPPPLRACEEFETQEAANEYLAVTPEATPVMDTDGDGNACEVKFAPEPAPVEEVSGYPPAEETLPNGCVVSDPACIEWEPYGDNIADIEGYDRHEGAAPDGRNLYCHTDDGCVDEDFNDVPNNDVPDVIEDSYRVGPGES